MTWAVFLVFLSINANEKLQISRELYMKGDFLKAAAELDSLLSSGQLTEKEEIVAARKYLGASYFILGKQDKAREEFKEILKLDPNVGLSLKEFPPEIVNFFNEVKIEIKTTMEETGQAPSPSTAAPKEETIESTTGLAVTMAAPGQEPIVRKRGSLAFSILPFGVGQLYQREKLKGYLLMGGETALLTINLVSLFERLSMRNSDGTYNNPHKAESLKKVQNISAIGFYAALAYGLGDSLWEYFRKDKKEPAVHEHSKKEHKKLRWGLALGTREELQIWLVF